MNSEKTKRCSKTQYKNKKDAQTMLSFIRKSGRKDQNMPQRVYFCSKCKAFHITHNTSGEVVEFTFNLPEDTEIVNRINQIIYEQRNGPIRELQVKDAELPSGTVGTEQCAD